MNEFLSNKEINQFNQDGAIFIKGKFDLSWIKKLKKGIERDIKNPSLDFLYLFQFLFLIFLSN